MTSPHNPSDSHAKSDSRALLAELWHTHQSSISAYLFAAVPNFHDAEDLLQQVAIAVARDFDKYDPDTSFIRWAITIARHRVLNHRRSKATSKVMFSQEAIELLANAAATQPAAGGDFRAALDRCLGKLQARARQALELRYTEDLRAKQIAKRLGITANAVSVLLHRTRASLEQCVKDTLAAERGRTRP